MNSATVIRWNAIEEKLDYRPSLEEAQQIVEGYIELLPVKGTRTTLIVNEDGRVLKLALNSKATAIYGSVIVGNVIVLEGWRTVG